jgi:hypothetical protein
MKQVLEHRTTSKEVRADFLEGVLKLREKYGDVGEKDTFLIHNKQAKIKQKCDDGSGISKLIFFMEKVSYNVFHVTFSYR